jgi:leucine-rich PPR motif-containing protein
MMVMEACGRPVHLRLVAGAAAAACLLFVAPPRLCCRGFSAPANPAPRRNARPPQRNQSQGLNSLEIVIADAEAGRWDAAMAGFHACVGPPVRDGDKEVRACNRLLRILGDEGRITEAVEVYSAMVAVGLAPTLVTYSTLISRIGAKGESQLAEQFFSEMVSKGIVPDVAAYNSLLNCYSKTGDAQKALDTFSRMVEAGLIPSVVTMNTLMDGSARLGDIATTKRLLSMFRSDWRLSPNERTYSILINSHVRVGQLDESFGVLEDMVKDGLSPNIFTYSMLIDGCAKAGQLQRAFSIVKDMRTAGLKLNVVTYTALVDACARSNELDIGFSIVKEMVRQGVKPNSVTYSALMDGCLKSGAVDTAFEVLRFMLLMGVKPTTITYTSLLSECARLGRVDQAAQVFRDMRQFSGRGAEVTPAPSSPSPPGDGLGLLRLFGDANRVEDALAVVEDMIERGSIPNNKEWRTLFDSVDTCMQLDEALRLLQLSKADRGDSSSLDKKAYRSLLRACGRTNQLTKAFLLLKELRDSGMETTEESYLPLLESCLEPSGADPSMALQVFESMRSWGVVPSARSYTSVIEAISKEGGDFLLDKSSRAGRALRPGERAGAGRERHPASSSPPIPQREDKIYRVFLAFHEMKAQGIQPDLPAYNALIHSCAKAGDLQRAMQVLDEMVNEQGIEPDVITYTSLIKAAGNAAQVDIAEDIFAAMQQRTNHFSNFCEPTERTYSHIMAANVLAGRHGRVFDLWSTLIRVEGARPTLSIYRQMLRACEGAKDVARGLNIYAHMKKSGERPDNQCLLSLTRLCDACGRGDQTRVLMRDRSSRWASATTPHANSHRRRRGGGPSSAR